MPTMAKNRKRPDSKRTAGADRHLKPRLAFHLDEPLLEAVERYIAATSPRPTTTSTMVAALEAFLKDKGFWPPPVGGSTSRPAPPEE